MGRRPAREHHPEFGRSASQIPRQQHLGARLAWIDRGDGPGVRDKDHHKRGMAGCDEAFWVTAIGECCWPRV
jgi:hypothetical protein